MNLQEKRIKVNRSLKTFKNLLNDVRVKNTSATQEIAQYWPEIESFLKDSKIVFEFEGYFTGTGTKSVSLPTVTKNIIDFIGDNFWYEDNKSAWEAVKKAKGDLSIKDYINAFANAEDVKNKFYFNVPKFGFVRGRKNEIYVESLNDHNIIDQIKSRLRKVFNTLVKASTKYHQHIKQDYPDYWFIEHDGSLTSHYEGFEPFEIVSAYTSIKDAPMVLKKFKTEVFDYFKGINDETTGGHINITCDHSKLDFIKLVMLADDHRWLKTFNRDFNNYCKSQYTNIVSQIEHLPNGLTFDRIISNLRVNLEKYSSFNFLKTDPSTVEFRVPGDDYLGKKFNETQQALDWFVFVIAVGLNKQMFRQEYMSKVMRIYLKSRKEKQHNNNIPSPFIARLIYFMKDNDEMKENLDELVMYMLNFMIRNKNITISKKDRKDFQTYCFPLNSISGLEYTRRFKKLLFAYLTQASFVSDIRRNYYATNLSHIQAIIKHSIYPYSEIAFTLDDSEQEIKDDLVYMIPEFIRLCATLRFNFTLVDYKGLDQDG